MSARKDKCNTTVQCEQLGIRGLCWVLRRNKGGRTLKRESRKGCMEEVIIYLLTYFYEVIF